MPLKHSKGRGKHISEPPEQQGLPKETLSGVGEQGVVDSDPVRLASLSVSLPSSLSLQLFSLYQGSPGES